MSRPKIRSGFVWLSSVALATALLSAIGMAWSAPTSSGGSPTGVKTTYGGDPTWFTHSSTWVNVPGAKLSMKVPDGQKSLFLARFSAYTACYNADDPFAVPCEVRIRVVGPSGTSTMNPKTGLMHHNNSEPDASAIDRSLGPVGAGSYEFRIQVRNIGTAPRSAGVGYWHMTMERLSA